MSSSTGHIFKLSTFGESHASAIGGIIEGCPANISIDLQRIQDELGRRKPGQSKIVSQRKEMDQVEFLSGIMDGKSLGTPIGFIIRNEDSKSEHYEHLKENFRPSHADFTYEQKYGIRDHRGGGRSSARETANWVVAGALAKQVLETIGVDITAYVDQVGDIKLEVPADFNEIENNLVRCPDKATAERMTALIEAVRKEGDTIGGSIRCELAHVPPGLGEPVFDKLHASLGKAMFSINAVKGVEFGSGFACVSMRGSAHNDIFNTDGSTRTNHSGGIQGGISNGMPIEFRVAFKPVATIMQKQESINNKGEQIELKAEGRHDPCVVPRAVPIVEALAAMVILDHYLLNRAGHM